LEAHKRERNKRRKWVRKVGERQNVNYRSTDKRYGSEGFLAVTVRPSVKGSLDLTLKVGSEEGKMKWEVLNDAGS
jgi:hypothetical protein